MDGISGGGARTVTVSLAGRRSIGKQRVPACRSCVAPGIRLRPIGDGHSSRAAETSAPLGLGFDGQPVKSALP